MQRLSENDKFLILASDGLWDKCRNIDVVEVAKTALSDGRCISTRLIEKVICSVTGGLDDNQLATLFAMNPRARRALHDDVTVISISLDTQDLNRTPSIGELFMALEDPQHTEAEATLETRMIDIDKLIARAVTDSECSDQY